jgi:hypothetical protein
MSYVVHDRRGYLCDLASAYACSGVMNWLDGIEHSPLVTEFLVKGKTLHPRKLAGKIEQLLLANPPNADVTDVAKAMARAFRRARGYAELTQ